MLINNKNHKDHEGCVKFVSYTGTYPCLCHGVLTLLINDEEVRFGHESGTYDYENHRYTDGNYDRFWTSGGYIDSDYHACGDEWEIDVNELPNQYRQYATEIDTVFNDNVDWGCCGGCI